MSIDDKKRNFSINMRPARPDRGYIMLVTLGLMLVLTVTGTLLYMRTERHMNMATAVRLQAIAVNRATQGAEATIAQIKANPPAAIQDVLPCLAPTPLTVCKAQGRIITGPSGIIPMAYVDKGTGTDLNFGGGLQYSVDVYVRTNAAGLQPTLILDSWGYYGYNGSPNLISGQTQVEMSMPGTGAGGPPGSKGGYAGGS